MPDEVIDIRTTRHSSPTPLALVFGGGGAVGIAWHLAVLEALRRHGFDTRHAPSIGTSAGAWACGAAHLGLGIEAFDSIGELDLPNRSPGFLAGMARGLIGTARVPHAHVSAVEIPSMRHRLFSGADHDLADLIAASSAVPTLFAPHTIGSKRYVDGGVRSMTSAHAAHPARLLVASLPIGGHLFGAIGRSLEHSTRRALARWRRRHGGTTMVLRPGRRVARVVGSRPRGLMSTTLALDVYPVALDSVTRRIESRLDQIEAHRARVG